MLQKLLTGAHGRVEEELKVRVLRYAILFAVYTTFLRTTTDRMSPGARPVRICTMS
jgi:hypothetical protein